MDSEKLGARKERLAIEQARELQTALRTNVTFVEVSGKPLLPWTSSCSYLRKQNMSCCQKRFLLSMSPLYLFITLLLAWRLRHFNAGAPPAIAGVVGSA